VAGPPQPPPEVAAYYAAFAEEARLASGPSQLEFERTREILIRMLPPPPATRSAFRPDPRPRSRDRAASQRHRPIEYFTTAYFHRPEELRAEFESVGFSDVQVLGVEGIGEWLTDFDERWADPALRYDLLDVARRLEAEPSIVGMSAHLLVVGRRV